MERQITFRLSEELLTEIDRAGRRSRKRRSDVLRDAVAAYVAGGVIRATDRPYDRVRDLVGSLSGGPPDLGSRHREYLRKLIRDRR